jgi:hypothetical protein
VPLAVEVIVSLAGRRPFGCRTRERHKTAGWLQQLYVLAHKYVRIEEDKHHADGVCYTPTLRDQAQQAREGLIAQIRELPGKEAYSALMQLATEHPEERLRGWCSSLARRRAEQDANGAPWEVAQVLEFQDAHERTPATHRELSELACSRLLDIRMDLEDGNSSEAELLMLAAHEREARKYVGGRCRLLARGRYTIPQEEELADAARPDLRFLGAGFSGAVPVELKLADNWSLPDLIDALEGQLCGRYLRDQRSTNGVLLLINRKPRKKIGVARVPDRT